MTDTFCPATRTPSSVAVCSASRERCRGTELRPGRYRFCFYRCILPGNVLPGQNSAVSYSDGKITTGTSLSISALGEVSGGKQSIGRCGKRTPLLRQFPVRRQLKGSSGRDTGIIQRQPVPAGDSQVTARLMVSGKRNLPPGCRGVAIGEAVFHAHSAVRIQRDVALGAPSGCRG